MSDNKIKLKHIISITISILITLTVIVSVYIINRPNKNIYGVKEGVLDLRDWDYKNINLDGQWEFYKGVLLTPDEVKEHEYITVPGSWNENMNGAEGSGTYRLKIILPKEGEYGLKTKTIRLASKIYLNGKESTGAGIVALNREGFKPESKYKVGVGSSENKEMEIIIQVSNYGYRIGGILRSIRFGTFEDIIKENNLSRALDALVISVCLVLGIYFFIIYLQRIRELYLLYFSMANVGMAIYLSTMNDQLLDLVFDYGFITRTRIQASTMIIVSVFLLLFTYNYLRKYCNKKTVRLLLFINMAVLTLTFKNPENMSSLATGIHQGIAVLSYMLIYINITYTLIKAIYYKEESLEYILIITISLVWYWILIGMKVAFEINSGYLSVMLMLFMFMGVSSLMSHKLQMDYQKVNMLTEKLLRQDKLKDEFLARASHELRTPLHIILNLTKKLLEGQKGSLNPEQQKDLFFVQQEGQRLTRLVSDLLNASQIKEGEIKLRLETINSNRIVEDILKEMGTLITDDKNIELKNMIPKDFPLLEADSDKFRQIIYNLVHNSIKYTEKGEIIIEAVQQKEKAEFRIIDTGMGIERQYHSEVFEAFYQKDEGKAMEQGLGLGLAIVKYLVEIQGGEITLESVYGEGTCIKFSMPICGKDDEERGFKSVDSKIIPILERKIIKDKSSPWILIVDDEQLNQKVLIDMLEELNYNMILADDGIEALEIIEKENIDLIILDFMLPDIQGDELCKEIRKKKSMIELPILILTASGSTMDLIKAFDYGVNDFQRKPIVSEELISRVESLLLIKKTMEEGLEKEFKYFYSQISPHFLYNTINTIIGISYKDNDLARKALNNLSLYFRGKLDVHRAKGLIPLEKELELIQAYLEIEGLRYGNRMEVEYDVDEGLRGLIPPLTLQPIVENAVRHGISSKKDKGIIQISVKRYGKGYIVIEIEDNGVGMTEESQRQLLEGNSERIGFKNVMEKIKRLRGGEIRLESELGKGTKVTIIIQEVKYNESSFN